MKFDVSRCGSWGAKCSKQRDRRKGEMDGRWGQEGMERENGERKERGLQMIFLQGGGEIWSYATV